MPCMHAGGILIRLGRFANLECFAFCNPKISAKKQKLFACDFDAG